MRRCHREGDRDGFSGGVRGTDSDRGVVSARSQTAGGSGERERAGVGPRGGTEAEPRRRFTGGPSEGAAAGVTDRDGLRDARTAVLLCSQCDTVGCRADRGW